MMKEDNNELENLYSKAANDFPLNTEGSDWQYVLNKLEEKERKPLFWLFDKRFLVAACILLLIASAGFYANEYMHSKNEDLNIKKNSELSITQQSIDKKTLTEEITNSVYKKIIDSIGNVEKRKLNNISNNNRTNTYGKPTLKTMTNSVASPLKATNIKTFKPNDVSKSQITQPKIIDGDDVIANKKNIANSDNGTAVISLKNDKTETIKPKVEQTEIEQVNKPNAIKQPNKSKFYVGVLASGEVSSLGFKTENKNDDEPFDFGFAMIAGLQLSKKISIETGLIFRKKEYYTSSDNFNKSILPLKGNMIGIEAESKLIEIPVTMNFNLLNTHKHNLYASFGVSSYIVNSEHYEYEEEVNGVISKETTLFTQTSSNFLATCNLGLGYQFKLNAQTNLRVQPYINLPLTGLGKGSEPVVSKGIFIGLTRIF